MSIALRADQQFARDVLQRRREICAETMHLPPFLFNKIDGCVTVEMNALHNISADSVGSGSNGVCFTGSLRAESYGINQNILFKWANTNSSVDEIAHLHNLWCLGHPNICQPIIAKINNLSCPVIVWERATEGNRYAITMVAIRSTEIGAEDRTVEENMVVYTRLADCMNFIHFHGLRHWDLHGNNYIVNEYGEPIIIDFGKMSSPNAGSTDRFDDITAIIAAVSDLNLDSGAFPFQHWPETFESMEQVCASLGPLSIGPLAIVDGVTPTAGLYIRYVYLAGVDIHQFEERRGLEILTCYDQQIRDGQRQRIAERFNVLSILSRLFPFLRIVS